MWQSLTARKAAAAWYHARPKEHITHTRHRPSNVKQKETQPDDTITPLMSALRVKLNNATRETVAQKQEASRRKHRPTRCILTFVYLSHLVVLRTQKLRPPLHTHTHSPPPSLCELRAIKGSPFFLKPGVEI